MNESQLTEVFGSADRFRALRALFAEPSRGFGLRELAAEAGVDSGNVSRMLKRWVAAGLVVRRVADGLPRYHVSPDPTLAPLVQLMQQDSALVRTLREALQPIKGIQVALLFGSVARGQAGAGSDIDVLVLGHVSELKVNVALKPAGRSLGREIHATACTIDSFHEQLLGRESFAQDIVRGPRTPLIGDFDAEIFSGAGRRA